jgi:hypothetical protein
MLVKTKRYVKKRYNEPSRVFEFYSQGFRTFLPQSLIEDFDTLVCNELNERRRYWQTALEKTDMTWRHAENPYEAFKDRCYDEARLREVEELDFLAAELSALGLYRFLEIERGRVLIEHLPSLDPTRLSSITYLNKAIPILRRCFGADAIDELRLICNCIKHSGRVSSSLARCHSSWQEGERLTPLRTALERIAPFIGAYWVDLLYRLAEEFPVSRSM